MKSFTEYCLHENCERALNLGKKLFDCDQEINLEELLDYASWKPYNPHEAEDYMEFADLIVEICCNLNEINRLGCFGKHLESLQTDHPRLQILIRKVAQILEETAPRCPECGAQMLMRQGPYGAFWGCSMYGRTKCPGKLKVDQPPSKPINSPNKPAPRQVERPAMPQPASVQRTWYAATALGDLMGKIKKGQDVALSKNAKGDWDCVELNPFVPSSGWAKIILPATDIAKLVKSMLDAQGNKISGMSPEEVLKKLQPGNKEKATPVVNEPKPTGMARYQIPPEKLTAEQDEITQVFNNPAKQNIVIKALAGTGKTTMLSHLSSFVKPGDKWRYLAFNVKNEQEGKKRLPRDVPSLTTHKFIGAEILSKNIQSDEMKDKTLKILADDSITYIPHDVPRKKQFPVKKMIFKVCGLAKNSGIDPRRPDDALKLINDIVAKYDLDLNLSSPNDYDVDVDYPGIIINNTMSILKESLPEVPFDGKGRAQPCSACNGSGKNKQGVCANCLGQGKTRRGAFGGMSDFDDVLWWSALYDHWRVPKLDVTLADEVQDFNANQIKIIKKLGDAGSRLVVVGDENQAIYGFRGADHEAFSILTSMLGETGNGSVETSLSINFRCGSDIINFVKEAMSEELPAISALKSPEFKINKDGSKEPWHKGEVNLEHAYGQLLGILHGEFQNSGGLSEPTTILCRTNGPLIRTAFNLLKMRVPIKVVGNDIAKSLKDVIFGITKKQNMDIENFTWELDSYLQRLKEKYADKIEHSAKMTDLSDNYDSITAIMEDNPEIGNTDALINVIDKYFDNKDDISEQEKKTKVILSSGHRSKGLEFDRVMIIRPDLVPHPRATSPLEQQQEYHTKYVMLTRAKNKMFLAADSQPKGKHEK